MLCTYKGSMVQEQYCPEWTGLWYGIPRLFDSFVPRWPTQSSASLLSTSGIYYWLASNVCKSDTSGSRLKGTNGRQKTYEIFHVYCIFYSGFMCQTTVICGITKDGSFLLNTLASWNCFSCRNLFQNGANDMSECLTCETAFCKKSSKFFKVRIILFWSNFPSLW